MTELNDITIEKAASGNKRSFRELYDFYSPFVWKVVFRTVNGDMYGATQVTQDVFVKVHRVLHSFKYDASFSTWLYRITFNTCMTYITKKATYNKRTITFDDEINTMEKNNTYEEKNMVHTIFKTLTPEERFLLVSREVNDIPFEELAEITGKNSGAHRTMLHRLKEHIRKGFDYETGRVLSRAV